MFNIEQVIKSELDFVFIGKGYIFNESCYFLNGSDFLTYCLGFDFENETYRVFVGVNRRKQGENFDKAPEGAYLHRYFTGGSLSTSPKDFIFKDEEGLRKHLVRLKSNLEGLIFPFFESASSLEKYADELSKSDCMVSYEIYQELGLKKKAIKEGNVVLVQYKNMRDIPAIDGALNDIENFLFGEEKTLNKLLQRIKKSFAFLSR